MKPLQCGQFGLNWSFGTLSGKEGTFKAGLDTALQHLKAMLGYFVCVAHVIWTLRQCPQVPYHWCLWNEKGSPLVNISLRNQDQGSSWAKLFCHLLEIQDVRTWTSIWSVCELCTYKSSGCAASWCKEVTGIRSWRYKGIPLKPLHGNLFSSKGESFCPGYKRILSHVQVHLNVPNKGKNLSCICFPV